MYKYADTTPFSRRFNHEETPWSRQPHHFNVCRVIVQLFRWCCWIQLSNSFPKSWLHTKPRVCGECLVLHKTPQLEHREWHHGYSLELQREPTLIFRMWLLSVLTQARDNYLYSTVQGESDRLREEHKFALCATIRCQSYHWLLCSVGRRFIRSIGKISYGWYEEIYEFQSSVSAVGRI